MWLADDARRFAESGAPAAVPRLAATVILARPSQNGFEVYAQRRAATMAFAPNMYVFPGGTVDPRDSEATVSWTGPSPTRWGAVMGLPESDARAVICAAVREVFEECGVLLAGPATAPARGAAPDGAEPEPSEEDESTVIGDVSGDDWEAARVALLARELALVDLLATRGLALRTELLAPWARWLTPEFEPRRYDTYFFLARLPVDQRTRDVGGEADHALWLPPADAARLPMLPPTAHTLARLAEHSDVDTAMAASVGLDLSRPITPRIHVDDNGAWLLLDE
jgi:8-oxo-dGTP pyrophosphatase MutT (NUDIX family)